jgi:hypothetical protein
MGSVVTGGAGDSRAAGGGDAASWPPSGARSAQAARRECGGRVGESLVKPTCVEIDDAAADKDTVRLRWLDAHEPPSREWPSFCLVAPGGTMIVGPATPVTRRSETSGLSPVSAPAGCGAQPATGERLLRCCTCRAASTHSASAWQVSQAAMAQPTHDGPVAPAQPGHLLGVRAGQVPARRCYAGAEPFQVSGRLPRQGTPPPSEQRTRTRLRRCCWRRLVLRYRTGFDGCSGIAWRRRKRSTP